VFRQVEIEEVIYRATALQERKHSCISIGCQVAKAN